MNKNSSVPRWDILSLNFRDLKSLTSKKNSKLQVSKENLQSQPINQNLIRPWMISPSNQFLLSRHKVGNELLKHCRNGFHLDDPHMYKSRFCVNYYRLHDPALKRYYKKASVKSRLKKLNLINEKSDAICSNKDFVEYLRYLDDIRVKNLGKSLKLSNHMTKVNKTRENDSQFKGIFHRKKAQREANLDMYLSK